MLRTENIDFMQLILLKLMLICLFETRIETTLSIHLKITPKNISVSSDASGRRKAQGKGRPLCDYRTKL